MMIGGASIVQPDLVGSMVTLMEPGGKLFAICGLVLAGCATNQPAEVLVPAQVSVIELENGAKLHLGSRLGTAIDKRARALAVEAHKILCGSDEGWACISTAPAYASIRFPGDGDCRIWLNVDKYRIENPSDTVTADANLLCHEGRPLVYRVEFYRPGEVAPTDGPYSRPNPYPAESRLPVREIKSPEKMRR